MTFSVAYYNEVGRLFTATDDADIYLIALTILLGRIKGVIYVCQPSPWHRTKSPCPCPGGKTIGIRLQKETSPLRGGKM